MRKLASALLIATALSSHVAAQQWTVGNGTKIVDSRGTVVGNVFALEYALRLVDNEWVQFNLVDYGVVQNLNNVVFFSTSDCSGQAYMEAGSFPHIGYILGLGPPGPNGTFSTGTLYFPASPFGFVSVGSNRSIKSNSSCNPLSSFSLFVGQMKSIALPGFVPPFTIR
jgi:hypothetical protein